MTQFKATVNGEPLEGTWNHAENGMIEATVGDRTYAVHALAVEPGIYWVKFRDRSIQVAVVPGVDGYSVNIGSARVRVEVEDTRSALRQATVRAHEGTVEIRAPMPGRIVSVLATEGAAVQAGEGILIMEAMKMQNEIKSPKAGSVKKIYANEGAAVNDGDLLAVIE